MRIGSAGSIKDDVNLMDIVMAMGASTDTNFIRQFNLPGTFAPIADYTMLSTAIKAADKVGANYHVGNVFSTDIFYDADNTTNTKMADMGCLCVEMETAALYMNAAYNQVSALAMVTITDHFVTGEHATAAQREKQNDDMIRLALETVIR